MTDVQRACRIDASELHLQPPASADVQRAVAGLDTADQAAQPRVRETEVHVAPRRLGDRRAFGHMDRLGESRGDCLWVLVQHPGELQARRRRVIAVLRNFGAAQLEVWNVSVDSEPANCVEQSFVDAVAHSAGDDRCHVQVGCWDVSVSSAWVDAPSREYVTVTRWLA